MLKMTRLAAVAAVVFLYLGYVWLQRSMPYRAPSPGRPVSKVPEWLKDDGKLRILSFYAAPGVLLQGDSASVCYSVRHARAVRLDPPVATVRPTLNACFELEPANTGTYKLTAEGEDGRIISESLTITVEPAPPWFTMLRASAWNPRAWKAATRRPTA